MLRQGVFLDRDGVLVRPVLRHGLAYAPLRWEDFAILRRSAEAVQSLRESGRTVIVVTNQPEVRRGQLDPRLLEQFHARLRNEVGVDDILVCPHDDRDHCDCRKPQPGMILEGARRHNLDLSTAWLVGDTDRDLGAAQAAAIPFILIDAPYNKDLQPGCRVADLGAAVRVILNR
jgi:D-glycero-D-manno-heptose 1,7-bisphosphate phosphatase